MKSEFYREISNERRTRKSTTKQKKQKQTLNSSHINPIRMSKGFKSETRALVRSIDLNKQYKLQTDQRLHRMSFSKPVVDLQEDYQIPQINQKSIISVCCDCQNLKSQQQKQLKSLKMHYQQELTSKTQKYIQMQKKYLIKDNQYIKLSGQYRNLLHNHTQLKQTNQFLQRQLSNLRYKHQQLLQDIERIVEELKKAQEHMIFFNHFLTAFVEQTKCMLSWANLFDNHYEKLPNFINKIRLDLSGRKMDLDVMLKQSINYQNQNFAKTQKKEYHECSFFGSQEGDSNSSLMKYLKQNPTVSLKAKQIRVSPFTQIKDKSWNQTFSINKQNIDTTNRPSSFEELIHSRLQQQLQKQKYTQKQDQLFRLLLLQAQTIQSNDFKSTNQKHSIQIDGSVLSSIHQQYDCCDAQ